MLTSRRTHAHTQKLSLSLPLAQRRRLPDSSTEIFLSAGSARSLEHGLDDLLRRAKADERVAQRVVADGGLHADHVPWLARAGVRQFHLDDQVRPGGSRKAYVDEALVRSRRTLIDTEVQHARAAGR